ncbi:MAG: hypothetical protein PHF84_06705 [bacterium]|nr:hypothetical protein [bacterium]
MKRVFLILFFTFSFCTCLRAGLDLQLTDCDIYSELKNKLSNNTNMVSKNYETFQEVKFKIKFYPMDKLTIWALFKAQYAQFHWGRDSKLLYVDAATAEYETTPVSKLMLGYINVNYSPYVAMSFPWVNSIFRGLSFEYNSYQFYMHVFAANNSENPDEANWDHPVTFDLDYRKNISRSFTRTENGVTVFRDLPSLWTGSKIRYAFRRNPWFTPDIAFIFFRENYLKKDNASGYWDVNANNIFGAEINFNLFDYITFKNTGAVTLNGTEKYNVRTNAFGPGRDDVRYTNTQTSRYFGGKLMLEINDMLAGTFGQYNTRGFCEYEKVESDYHPTYMNQNLDNRTINPYDTVFSGREGYWAGVEQNIGLGFFLGAGYQHYLFRKSWYHDFPDGAIFTEKQVTLKNEFIRQFRVFFIFQIQEMLKKTFPGGEKAMNSFYIRIQSDIVNNVYMELEYNRNKNYKKNYDEMMVKFLVWAW